MSACGTKRTFIPTPSMSAFGGSRHPCIVADMPAKHKWFRGCVRRMKLDRCQRGSRRGAARRRRLRCGKPVRRPKPSSSSTRRRALSCSISVPPTSVSYYQQLSAPAAAGAGLDGAHIEELRELSARYGKHLIARPPIKPLFKGGMLSRFHDDEVSERPQSATQTSTITLRPITKPSTSPSRMAVARMEAADAPVSASTALPSHPRQERLRLGAFAR